jgi:hypothetical protein
MEILAVKSLADRVRNFFSGDDDELNDVVFFVGPPRCALDIADELEREQAAKAAQGKPQA